jgi:hypothetical protein
VEVATQHPCPSYLRAGPHFKNDRSVIRRAPSSDAYRRLLGAPWWPTAGALRRPAQWGLIAAAIGARGGCNAPETGRAGTRPWLPRWATSGLLHCKTNGRPFPNTTTYHRAYWQLNANQLSSGGDAKSHQTAERDEQLKRQEAAGLLATKIANLHHTNEVPSLRSNMG